MIINPQHLVGNWNDGYALDLHTTSSTPNGHDPFGHVIWDTTRPPIAEELYLLKYKNERHRTNIIAQVASDFVINNELKDKVDIIIPIPPSDTSRPFQPVFEVASLISKNCGLSFEPQLLKKVKATTELKGIDDENLRKEILANAFTITENSLRGKNILLFDDLYRSGATLTEATQTLLNVGKAKNVFVLTITKTRTRR